VFRSGVAGSQGFSFFPLWVRVMDAVRTTNQESAITPAATPPLPIVSPPAAAPGHRLGQMAAPQAGPCTEPCARAAWTVFLQSIRNLPRRLQLDAVNRWANTKPYVEDWANWGVPDYWETPVEFLRHGGDCEDYAIIKYFSLVRLGFSPDDLRIVIVNDVNLQAFHAVLAVRMAAQTWLMDNAFSQVVPMGVAVQYVPVYSLNEHGWWLYNAPRIVVSDASVAGEEPAHGRVSDAPIRTAAHANPAADNPIGRTVANPSLSDAPPTLP